MATAEEERFFIDEPLTAVSVSSEILILWWSSSVNSELRGDLKMYTEISGSMKQTFFLLSFSKRRDGCRSLSYRPEDSQSDFETSILRSKNYVSYYFVL